jgi:hypothetical protein
MTTKRPAKTIGVGVLGVVALWGVSRIVLRVTGFDDPNACISEQVKTILDLAGTKVDVVDTNCDLITKQEDVSVYFSSAAVKGESWFAKWTNRRTLVFSYDPRRPDHSLPSFTHPSQSTILISIPEVSSILYQNRKWAKVVIEYDIEHVVYPAAAK